MQAVSVGHASGQASAPSGGGKTEPVPALQRLDLKVGSVLAGKYRLDRALGFGGMGAVWVARNAMTGGDVALKVLHEEVENEEALERFRREANLAARLSHRGIVRVFDLVELHEGTLVMVMELLRGETLASRLDQYTTVPVDTAIGIILAIASALAHAHEAGIVHRDLKPENVFLCVEPDGAVEPKILDFGISKMTGPTLTKLTTDGTLLGTPGYMSPEQTRGDPVDARSDVFAMAILLYEMISGVNPFYGTSYNAVIAAILERDPEPLAQVSPEVWKVIDKAFSKKRNSRHASAMDFANALRNAAGFAGRGSSPMVDVASLGGTSSERAGRVASARRPISETPTQAASFLPDHWRLRLVAAGVTVAILGTAAVVMLRTSGSEAGRDHVEAPTTGAVGAVNANGTTATAPGPTASASVRAMDIPPAPPASVVGSPVPAGSIVLPPPLPSPDTAAPTLGKTPHGTTPASPRPGHGPAGGMAGGTEPAPAADPQPTPTPAPTPPPVASPPPTPPPAPGPSVRMQTSSGI